MSELGEELSERELDVLGCVVKGITNKEIAKELSISPNTVKVHLRNIYTKLGVSTRTEATSEGVARGLIVLPGMEVVEPPESTVVESEAVTEPMVVPEQVVEKMPAFLPAPPFSTPIKTKPTWRTYVSIFALVTAGILLLASLLVWRILSQRPPAPTLAETTAIPFVAEEIGNSRWFRDRPMAEENAGMAGTAIGLNLYFVGGETATGDIHGKMQVFDVANNHWDTATDKPTPVTDASAAVLDGQIYVVGGRTPDGATNVVEAYSPIEGAWRVIAPLPQPVADGLALSDGSFLYLIGGDNEGAVADVYVYSPATNSWGLLPSLPTPRTGLAGGEIAGILYAVGGSNETGELDTCEAYDIANETWGDCPPMQLPRNGAGAVSLNGNLYVFGGGMDGDVGFGEFYNANSGDWQVINMPMLTDSPQWADLAVAIVETRIFAVGGRIGGEISSNTYMYSPLNRVFIPSLSIDTEATPTEE